MDLLFCGKAVVADNRSVIHLCTMNVCGARRMSLARTPASLVDRGTQSNAPPSAPGSGALLWLPPSLAQSVQQQAVNPQFIAASAAMKAKKTPPDWVVFFWLPLLDLNQRPAD